MSGTLFLPATDGSETWALVVDLAMKVTVLYLLAMLLHVALCRHRPLARSGLWNALLAGLIVLPVATLAFPRLRVDFPMLPASDIVESTPATEASSKASSMSLDPRIGDQAAMTKVDEAPGRLGFTGFREALVEPELRSWRVHPAGVILFFYAGGCVILLIRLAASLWLVRLMKQTAVPVIDPAWTTRLDSWRALLRVRRRVELIESEHVRVPLAIGWFRPAIVLPPRRNLALAAGEIDAVFVHELGHLERQDDVWNLVQQILQIFYWPHPLTWVAARLIAEVREQACDDFCVHWTGGAHRYKMTLIVVAARLVEGERQRARSMVASPVAVGMAMARSSTNALRRRLAWIARRAGSPRCQLNRIGRAVLASLGFLIAFAVGSIELGRASASLSAPPQEKPFLAYDQQLPDSVRKAIVDVTVIDAMSRAPVVGAEVLVLNYVDLMFHNAATNQQGHLRVVYPYSDEPSVSIEVRREGYVPQRVYWGSTKMKDGPPRAVTVALRRGTPMGGLVTDEAGKPIAGVTVVASVDEYRPDDHLKDPLGGEILYEVPFRTGPDGRWRTESLPSSARKVSLLLIHPDYVSGDSTRPVGTRRPFMDLLRKQTDRQVLTKGVKLDGRVTDAAGKPIPGASISESSQGLTFLDYARHTESDVEGRFHFHFNPNEKVTLTVQVKGYEPDTKSLVVKPGVEPIEFRLEPGKVIHGRVVDLEGKPIPAANIIIPRFSSHQGVFLRTWTDSEGRFRWDSGPSKAVELSIGKEGYLWIERVPFVTFEQETVITLKPGLTVTVTARDAQTGYAIKEFSTETGISDLDTGMVTWKQEMLRTVTDGEHRTTLDATDGPYRFRVTSKGYESSLSRVVEKNEKEVALVIDLEKLPKP